MSQWGANRNPFAGYRMGVSQTPYPTKPGRGVKKSPFEIAAKRLEIDEKVNREHFRTHSLDVK